MDFGELYGIGMVLFIGGAFAYYLLKPPEKNRRLLRDVADKYGGTLVAGDLVLTVDGIEVTVLSRLPSDINQNKPGTTRWRAKVPPPGTTRFKVYPEGFVSFATKVFHDRDTVVGVDAFDNAFMVKGEEPAAVRKLWTYELASAMVEHYPDGGVHGEGDTIELVFPHELTTVEDVMRGVKLVVGLARADLYGIAVLRGLPEAITTASGAVEINGPGEIRIGPHRTADGVVTRVWATVEDDPARALPSAVGPATLDRTGIQMTITWPTIEEDPQRLTAAIEFLRSLVREPSQGVFR